MIKTFEIGGFPIEFNISEKNQVEKFFNLSKFKTSWHDPNENVLHFSQVLYCLLKGFLEFKLGRKDSLKTLGIFYIGNLLHEETQKNLLKKHGFLITEVPVKEKVNFEFEGKKYSFIIVGKADLLNENQRKLDDIKTTSWMPQFTFISPVDFEIKYGLYVYQVHNYIYNMNKYKYKFQEQEIEKASIILVSKINLFTQTISFLYDKARAEVFYERTIKRAMQLHYCLVNDIKPEPELNQYCPCEFGKVREYCPKGYELYLKKQKKRNGK